MDTRLVSRSFSHHAIRQRSTRIACLVVALSAPIERGGAQLVTPKTVPVNQGAQFEIFPSQRFGMGGVSLALDDTLQDPFVNPAKATRLRGALLFTTPYSHGIADAGGGGRTVPVGMLATAGNWSFAAVAALQQLDRTGPIWNRPISERTATNQYASGTLARRVGRGVSIGGSVALATLGAIDGVDLLYQGSDRIDQDGTLADLRLGLTKEWDGGRTSEILLLHNRTNMTHDVHFPAWWQFRPNGNPLPVSPDRTEHNVDRTNIWGLHTESTIPVGTEGWRVGWVATANHLSHPKIPNYQVMNIPRDPGTTWGFNLGAGAGRVIGGTSLGVDVVFEPMFSETWADAANDTLTTDGNRIWAGAKTVENSFRFSNSHLRLGIGHDLHLKADSSQSFGFQAGLGLYSIAYRLKQTNNVQRTFRTQDEHWIEWTPTMGLQYRTHAFDVRYSYSRTCGPSACRPEGFGTVRADFAVPAAGGIIAAPSGPLTLQGGRVAVHRLSIGIPIR